MALSNIEYGADKLATHSFTESSETKHVERVAPGAGVSAHGMTRQLSRPQGPLRISALTPRAGEGSSSGLSVKARPLRRSNSD